MGDDFTDDDFADDNFFDQDEFFDESELFDDDELDQFHTQHSLYDRWRPAIAAFAVLLTVVAIVIDTKVRCSNTEGASTAITGHRDYLWLWLGSLCNTKS